MLLEFAKLAKNYLMTKHLYKNGTQSMAVSQIGNFRIFTNTKERDEYGEKIKGKHDISLDFGDIIIIM